MVPGLADFSVALATARNTVHPAAAAAHLPDGRKFTFSLKQTDWGQADPQRQFRAPTPFAIP